MSKRVASDVFQNYNEKHAVEIMQMLNEDRKNKKIFCDGVLQSDGQDYSVHKCVVGVVSEFFEKLFLAEMREKYENVARVHNLTCEMLENILDYAYTGIANITDDNVCDLLMSADYTQIPGLETNCKDYLMKAVCAENSLKFRAYAQRHNLDDLQTKALQIIRDNLLTILQQDAFNELDVEEVSTIINLKKEQALEEAIFRAAVRWVNHNMEKRESLFSQLFSLIDLKRTSDTFLNRTVRLEPLVVHSLECMQRLIAPGEIDWVHRSPELSLVIIGGHKSETNVRVQSFKRDNLENLPNLVVGRIGAALVKHGHQMYVVGGGDKVVGSELFKSVEMNDLLEKDDWITVANMVEKRQFAASALLNGFIYVSGGVGRRYLASCEKYDCDLDQWTEVGRMLQARGYHAMVEMKGSLYCVGGTTGRDDIFASAECYDKTTDTWKNIAPMNKARWGLAAVAFNGRIYAIGGSSTGSDRGALTTVERYDPEIDAWTELRPLNVARCRHGACVSHGKIYVFGGNSIGGKRTSVEVYDEASDTWVIRFDMESCPHSCTVIGV